MDDLINEFIAETREMLEALSGAIVAWEAEPRDRARLDEIFRFVHTVKGNCGFFDLPRLQRLSHAAEDALAEVRAGRRAADAPLVSAALGVIDRIADLVQALESGEPMPADSDDRLIAALSPAAQAALAEPEAAGDVPAASRTGIRSIRLSIDLLDRMMNGVSDAVLARNELARCLRDSPGDIAVEAAFERVSASLADIRDAITRTRMQRIESLFAALPRMVRDLSGKLGKVVTLEVDGGDVELDREMIEMIRDPLSHIIRNAVDHGIEPSAQRTGAGKPAAGSLRVCARQAGNQIVIEVCDDGRGIDGERLLRKALASGLFTVEQGEQLSAAQKTALIFQPGLSTASEVTAVSGRGVGMDVVRANIERIGGVVEVDSKPGQGLRLAIRVPLTLTIIPALTVSSGGRTFAIPRSSIDEILRAGGASVQIETLGGSSIATIRGKRLPLVSLSALLALDCGTPLAEQIVIVLKPAGGDAYALAVDRVHDHEELVVKPAAPAVMAAGLYAGTTLGDDGRPMLLLDAAGIASCASIKSDEAARPLLPLVPAERPREDVPALLFRAFDGSKRAVRLALVERIEDIETGSIRRTGGKLRVAVNGRILPLAGCPEGLPQGKLRVLRLSDGACEIAYAYAEVIDMVSIKAEVKPCAEPGEIGGVTLIGGDQVELLDPYWLFAVHAGEAAGAGARPVCALPHGDSWMDNILRPMIESLGYDVVRAGEVEDVNILIASCDAAPACEQASAEILTIRSSPALSGENDNSIYRYDRDALMSALSRRAAAKRADPDG